jgi:hypothetical protein
VKLLLAFGQGCQGFVAGSSATTFFMHVFNSAMIFINCITSHDMLLLLLIC